MLAAGRIVAALLSAAWLAIAARHLPLSQFSDLALVVALGSVVFFVSDPGTSVLLSAHVARVGAIQPGAVREAVTRRIVGTGAALLLVEVTYLAASNDRSPIIPLLFAGTMIGNSIHTSYSAAFRSVGRVSVEAINEVTSRAALVALGSVWLTNGGGLRAAVLTYSSIELASAIVMTGLMVRHVRRVPVEATPEIDLSLRRSRPLALGSGVSTVYGRLDTWLVAVFSQSPNAAGLYGAAYRIMEALTLPTRSMGAVALSHGAQDSGEEGERSIRRLLLVGGAAVATGSVVVALVAPSLMAAVFGESFRGASTTLRVLAVAAVAGASASVLGPLAAAKAGPRYARVLAVGLLLNLGLNMALIPALGPAGAAWAFVVSEGFLSLMLARVLYGRRTNS